MQKEINKKQKQFIYLLLNYKDSIAEWLDSNLNIQKFDKEYRILLTFIKECFLSKDALLTKNNFDNYVRELTIPKDRAREETLYGACSLTFVEQDDFETLSAAINEYFFNEKCKIYLSEFSKKFKKEFDKRRTVIELKERLDNLILDSDVNKEIIYQDIRNFSDEFLDNIEKIRSGEKKEEPRILCGIPEIDETMITGFSKGTLTVFCSDVGGYKSAMMLNIGLNIWEQTDKNVLFVPIEMPKEQLYNRAISRQSRVHGEKIYNPKTLSEDEVKRLKETSKKWGDNKNQFYICEMPEETTVNSIKRIIERYISTFEPQVVIIDYIDNLEPDNLNENRRDLQIRAMIVKLRKVGQKMNFSIVSGAQLGKEALRKLRKTSNKNDKTLNSEDIRGAHTLAMYADNIYAQLPNSAQPDQLLDIYVVKARNGKKIFSNGSIKASLEIVPEIGLIRSSTDIAISNNDQEYMNKMLESEEGLYYYDDDNDNDDKNVDFNDDDNDDDMYKLVDEI